MYSGDTVPERCIGCNDNVHQRVNGQGHIRRLTGETQAERGMLKDHTRLETVLFVSTHLLQANRHQSGAAA